jgi:hypothetical protein
MYYEYGDEAYCQELEESMNEIYSDFESCMGAMADEATC